MSNWCIASGSRLAYNFANYLTHIPMVVSLSLIGMGLIILSWIIQIVFTAKGQKAIRPMPFFVPLVIVLFVFSACNYVENVDEQASLASPPTFGYKIKTNVSPDSTFESYLSYDDKEIVKLTDDKNPQLEYFIDKVFPGSSKSKDIVFITKGGGCAGCVLFLDHYYLVDKADLSFEKVNFEGPSGVDITWRGAPDWAVYGDLTKEMYYVNRVGDLEKNRDSYSEEIWDYNFDTKVWKLIDTVDNGETVACYDDMGFRVDSYKLHFWKQGGNVSPSEIPENIFDLFI